MSSNQFHYKRFLLLFKQHFIHNAQLLVFSTMAYVGVIFIVLSLAQLANEGFKALDLEMFQGFLIGFVTVFGVLYVGHSFPAFRSKESTIQYLMIPASVLEKFLFEFLSRIGFILVALPVLYWLTFNIHGYLVNLFLEQAFNPIGVQYLFKLEIPTEYMLVIYLIIIGGVMLVLSIVFTGAAMFDKQPLVKTLFSVAIIIAVFVGYSYIVIEHVGVGRYNPPESMYLIPLDEDSALNALAVALITSAIVMLIVAFRKLKEREV
jgi:hypothetical protein